MTTATFDKSIRYDRETRDFAARLNGEYIGSFSTHAAAEAALDQVAYDQLADGVALSASDLDGGSDADAMAEEVAAAVLPETAMVSIVEPGLVDANIQVWPHSTVELVERQPTANIWYALLVDGRYHNLVMKKHTIGRDYLISALNRALGQVEAAIEALNPQPAEPTPAPPPPPTRPGLIVSDGHFWRVEFDRAGGVWLAMITGVGCVGRSRTPLGAQTLCNAYMAGQRGRAAA